MDANIKRQLLQELGQVPAIELAHKYGISYGNLRCIASRAKRSVGPIPKAHKVWSVTEERMLEQLAGVVPLEQIARELARTPTSVKRKANAIGLTLTRFGEHATGAKHSNADVDLWRQLHCDHGLSASVIAEKFDVSRHTVADAVAFRTRRNG